MKKYFTFSDGISNKFWYIEANGKNLITITGKIGTEGKLQTKTCATPELCEKELLKQVDEKQKKGYEENPEIPEAILNTAKPTDTTAQPATDSMVSVAPQKKAESVLAKAERGIQGLDIRKFLRMVKKNELEIVKQFIEAGLDPNEDYEWGQGYETAIENGLPEMVKLLTPYIKGHGRHKDASYFNEVIRHSHYGKSETTNAIVKAMFDGGYRFADDPNIDKLLPHINVELAKELIEIGKIDVTKQKNLMVDVLESKNREMVEYLLDKGTPLTGVGLFSGLTVMHLALSNFGHDLPLIKRLVEAGGNVNAYSQGQYIREGLTRGGGETAIEYAKEHMSPEVAEFVGPGNDSDIPVEFAFKSARLDLSPLLQRFVEKEGPNVQDEKGRSLLHYACTADHECTTIQNAMYLIKKGINADLKDNMGRNAMFYYNFDGSGTPWAMGDEINKFLDVDNFFNSVLSKTSSMFWDELRKAHGVKEANSAEERLKNWLSGKTGDRDMLSIILRKAGADVECTDVKGMTPFMFHARYYPGEDENVDYSTSTEGREALSKVSLFGPIAEGDDRDTQRYFALKSLLRCQPDLSKRYPDDGATALHHMQTHKIFEKEELFKLMYTFGADVDAQDNLGRTPLHWVALCTSTANYMDIECEDSIEDLIVKGGANPDIQDKDGNTPLHLALRNKDEDNSRYSTRALLRFGADPTIKNNEGLSAEDILKELDLYKKYEDEIKTFKDKQGRVSSIQLSWNPIEVKNDSSVAIGDVKLHAALGLPEYSIRYITTLGNNKILTIGTPLDEAHCIDSQTGQVRWMKYHICYPQFHDEKLYAGCGGKSFGEISIETGEPVWSKGIGGELHGPISFYKNECALFAQGKNIVAMDLKKKKQRWKITLDDRFSKHFQIWNEYLIVAVHDRADRKLLYISIDSGEVKEDIELISEQYYLYETMLIGDEIWVKTGDIPIRFNLATENRLPTRFEFDDDSNWADYSLNSMFQINGQPYILVNLEPRNENDEHCYRVCRVEGDKAHTVANVPIAGKSVLYGNQLVTLGKDSGVVVILNMETRTWIEWKFPTFSGDDDVNKSLHVSDGCIFVSQEGGNQHQQQDLLYVLK